MPLASRLGLERFLNDDVVRRPVNLLRKTANSSALFGAALTGALVKSGNMPLSSVAKVGLEIFGSSTDWRSPAFCQGLGDGYQVCVLN